MVTLVQFKGFQKAMSDIARQPEIQFCTCFILDTYFEALHFQRCCEM